MIRYHFIPPNPEKFNTDWLVVGHSGTNVDHVDMINTQNSAIGKGVSDGVIISVIPSPIGQNHDVMLAGRRM